MREFYMGATLIAQLTIMWYVIDIAKQLSSLG